MTGTVASTLAVDDEELGAPGARVEVDCVDVIEVRDGLIASKQTYLDTRQMERQLGGGSSAPPPRTAPARRRPPGGGTPRQPGWRCAPRAGRSRKALTCSVTTSSPGSSPRSG